MTGERLKRLAAPRVWYIPRKTHKWAVKPSPGPHPQDRSIPLIYIIRDYLRYADTSREARMIISAGKVFVDGRVVRDYKFPVGLMDVISIPETDDYFRVIMLPQGYVGLIRIPKEASTWKLVRIENKTTVKGGKIQLNLHDGRNILLDQNMYKTGDVLKIEVPSQRILDVFEFKEGNVAMIIGGNHFGKYGIIERYEITRSPLPNVVYLRPYGGSEGEIFMTIKPYVFVVGREKPEITISGETIPRVEQGW